MVDKIVELSDNKKYVILDETKLDYATYCYGIRLNDNEQPTTSYMFFEEIKDEGDILLFPIREESIKSALLTIFTTNFLGRAYDEL